jgi:hypothetical protein
MALSVSTTFTVLLLISALYVLRIYIAGLFWTGVYQRGIEKATDLKTKARLYSSLGKWDERVQIDKKRGFLTAVFDLTYEDRMFSPAEDLLDFLDGIDALSNAGLPDVALSHLNDNYNPPSPIEVATKQRYIQMLENQKTLMLERSEYIQLALKEAQRLKFADNVDPFVYFRFFSFVILGQFLTMIYLWLSAKEKRKCIVSSLIFVASSVWYFVYLGATPLNRFLSVTALMSMAESLVFTPMEAAHRPSPNLERARQIFIQYPYRYEDLCTHQAMGLMANMLLKEVRRCSYPRPHVENEIQFCISANSIAQTIADMIDADHSSEFQQERDNWYWDILEAMQQEMDGLQLPDSSNVNNRNGADSNFLRISMQKWLTKMLDSEHGNDNDKNLVNMHGEDTIINGTQEL